MTHFKQTVQFLTLLLAVVFAQGCSVDNNDADLGQAESSDLVVSVQDLYWGTRDVGVETTQMLTLSNKGTRVIRINSVGLSGVNAQDFNSNLNQAVTLQAGETLDVAVSFAPATEGRKYASLEIDFDQI